MFTRYLDPSKRPVFGDFFWDWYELACPCVVEPDGEMTKVRPHDLHVMWADHLPADQVREVTLARCRLNPTVQ